MNGPPTVPLRRQPVTTSILVSSSFQATTSALSVSIILSSVFAALLVCSRRSPVSREPTASCTREITSSPTRIASRISRSVCVPAHRNTRFPDVHTSTARRRGSRRLNDGRISVSATGDNLGSSHPTERLARVLIRTASKVRSSHSSTQSAGGLSALHLPRHRNTARSPRRQRPSVVGTPAVRRAFCSKRGDK
jgi:hypothetical protein